MAHSPAGRARVEEQFSLPLFLFTVAATLAGLLLVLRFVAPDIVWQQQVSAGFGPFVITFLALSMLNCFMEYGFHRYVLHRPVVPFLSRFYRQHTLHHSLTRIGRRHTSAGREVPVVENIYPVITEEQGEASFFPWYTLLIFTAVLAPFLALMQWLVPSLPWFFGGLAALTTSLLLYELFHAIEHWSFDRWAVLIEHPRFGAFWRKVYSFHLRHHAVIDSNEAISGFFLLPVADWAFGTFLLPKSLYVDGSEWQASEFERPQPGAFIHWCDQKADAIVKARRSRARTEVSPAAAMPANYTRGEQIAHYFTHGTGLAASVATLVVLITFAALRGNVWHVISAIIFGVALVTVYLAFTHFRRVPGGHWRQVLHKYNHAAAFMLIAGTATPFLLVNLRGPWGWSLFGIVWTLCLTGAGFRLFAGERLRIVSRLAYLLLGLLAVVALKPFISTVPLGALWLLLGGAACYVIGTMFHVSQHIRYHQVVRHLFALGGTACHLIAVMVFVLPG
jgi:hemolysin III